MVDPDRIVLSAGDDQLVALEPLVRAWQRQGASVHLPGPVPDAAVPELAAGADAVLVVGDRRRSPRTVLAGPAITAPDGRVVPVAWLPATSPMALRRFAWSASDVHARAAVSPTTVAVLAQRHRRFGDLAERTVRAIDAAGTSGTAARSLTAHDVHRDDLVRTLARGPAVSVYLGHGRPIGWVGYAGLRPVHWGPAREPAWRPGALVLSLTCRTASRRRTGLSFAESIPLDGVAAAALGAVGPTLHTANARWAVRLSQALPAARTVGDLVAAVAPPQDPEARRYRLLGDPTAPLRDDPAWLAASTDQEATDVAH